MALSWEKLWRADKLKKGAAVLRSCWLDRGGGLKPQIPQERKKRDAGKANRPVPPAIENFERQ
jgi:hypothetical protein